MKDHFIMTKKLQRRCSFITWLPLIQNNYFYKCKVYQTNNIKTFSTKMLGKEKKGGVIFLKDTWQGGWGS